MVCLRFATLPLLVALVTFLKFGTCLHPASDSDETERIVSGKNAANGMYPWTVALYYEGNFICTGSIISERAVLTAAHCVVFNGVTQRAESFHATAGEVNRTASNVEYLNFAKLTVHPQYEELKNDLAILETVERIPFSKTIMPICIASPKIGRLESKRVTAMGWGQKNRNPNVKTLPDILQYAPQKVVSNLKCFLLFFGNPVPDTVLCARGLSSGVCYGDSGGPLVLNRRNKPVQVGIASYVNPITGCGKYLGPAGFTRVNSYTNYIMKTAAGSVCVI